jgi:hypothetical protein
MNIKPSTGEWSTSIPLITFCATLHRWMAGETQLRDELTLAAEQLCRDERIARMLPEELLLLIKFECLGITRDVEMDSGAISTPESRRYVSALDIVWTVYFRPRQDDSLGAGPDRLP